MGRGASVGTLIAAAIAVVAVAVAPAGASNVVKYTSSVTLGATLTGGKVSSPKSACIKGRKVVVKYTDARGKAYVFGTDKTDNSGRYQVTPGATPGKLPFKFKAVVKRRSEGTAGTTYVCKDASSKVRIVSGG
jgi:hypothetical protein